MIIDQRLREDQPDAPRAYNEGLLCRRRRACGHGMQPKCLAKPITRLVQILHIEADMVHRQIV
jgi:hypothetical protein